MIILLVLATSIVSTFGVAYLFHKLVDLPRKINVKALIFFILGVLCIGYAQYFKKEFMGNILFFVYYPLLFYVMKPMPFRKVLYYTIMIWLYGMAVDLLSMLIVSSFNYVFDFNLYSYYSESVLTALVCAFLILIGYSKKLKNFTSLFYKKLISIKYSELSLVLFIIFIFFIGTLVFLNLDNLTTSFLLSLLIIIMVVTLIILIKFKINEEENNKYLKLLKENNEFYIKIEDENRIFKHNLMAKLLSIKSVSNKKAMALIEDLLMEFNKNLDFSKSLKVIPYGLDGIIYQKLYPNLNNLNVKLSNSINYDIFTELKPRRYNVFVEKIVIALDNAIEAALNSDKKIVVVNIYDDNEAIVTEIRNTFSNAINIDDLGSKNYTTKGKKHGIGLFSAFRNNEASLEVKVVENFFVSKITAKKKITD